MEKGPRDRASKASTDCSEKLVHVIPEEETGGYTLWIDELNIGEYGETLSEARDALLGAVRSYVCDYLDWYVFYRNFRDKVGQYPYILRLSLVRDDAELRRLLFAPMLDDELANP